MGVTTPGAILGAAVFLQFLLLCVRLLSSPPYGDSDIFQYIGWYMAHGGTLYESCWDNKGPLVFAFSAAGMLFGETGFKIFCFLAALAILGLMYKALTHRFSRIAAAWGAFMLSLAVSYIDGGSVGNRAEVTAAIFLSLGLLLFFAGSGKCEHKMVDFLQGTIVACLFMAKATFVGYGLFLSIYWCLEYWKSKNKRLFRQRFLWSLAGFFAGMLVCLTPFIIQGTVADLYDGSFYYNAFEYNKEGGFLSNFATNMYRTWPEVSLSGIMLLMLFIFFHRGWSIPPQFHLAVSASAWLIGEFVLTSTVNTFFPWYLLPASVAVLLLGLSLWEWGEPKRLFRVATVLIGGVFLLQSGLFIARVSCHNLLRSNVEGKGASLVEELGWCDQPAVVCGGAAVCRMARSARIRSHNKYIVNVLHYQQTQSAARKKRIIDDAVHAMNAPGARRLLSECKLEHLPWYRTNETFRRAAGNWNQTTVGEGIHFYEKLGEPSCR